MRRLSPREARFCEEYEIDFCAAKAAARAGYSPKTARSQGSRLLARPAVAAAIREAREKRSGVVALQREEIEGELRRIALDGSQKTADRLRALELAGKALGMFVDKSELTMSSFEEVVMRAEKKFREASAAGDGAGEEQANGARSEAEAPAPAQVPTPIRATRRRH
jgi:phage terminase small subunit